MDPKLALSLLFEGAMAFLTLVVFLCFSGSAIAKLQGLTADCPHLAQVAPGRKGKI
mgnify:CR=1 FL=1|tara:strand:- start:678 stop:845 length:168 start_codon:yes stop_codon:yes gene_type:complete